MMRYNTDFDNLRELFGQVLNVLMKESRESITAVVEDGVSVDLFELFMAVRERGGGGYVAKFAQWGTVAEEIGLRSSGGASVAERVYARHLGILDQWVQGLGSVGGSELLERKLRELLLCISSGDEENRKNGNNDQTKCLVDERGDSVEEGFSRKRKREKFSGMLSWLVEVAKNPSDIAFANLGESYKQKGYRGKEFMMLVLAAREALFQSGRDEFDLEENGNRITESSVVEKVVVDKDGDSVIVDRSVGGEEVLSCKRKRGTFSGMLNWLTETAKNPDSCAFRNIGEAYKQKEYKGEQIPGMVLLARDALRQAQSIRSLGESNNSPSQKKLKMHPSMYEDQSVADHLSKRFSPRILSQINSQLDLYNASSEFDVAANPFVQENDPFDEGHDRKPVPVGPLSQADVPEWTGVALDSDPKWLGTSFWRPKATQEDLHAKEVTIGKGRQVSCHCRDPGSIECVKVHIAEEKERLKSELGIVYYLWGFHRMGEGASQTWTKAEEKRFNSTVRLNPPSMNKFFWNKLHMYFRTKSWKSLVSYYFNVFVVRRRTYQNRLTPCNIDSDDYESEVDFFVMELKYSSSLGAHISCSNFLIGSFVLSFVSS